ncbi:MAG: hypothetical protein WB661_02560 [Candidatus Bathyarchaeia archaeon]
MRQIVRSALFELILALVLVSFLPAISGTVSDNVRACSSLIVQTDMNDYAVGEPVNITVTFLSLLPGCMQPMIAHDYVVQIQVLNASNQTAYSSTHVTAGALIVSEKWTPTSVGDYTIIASAFFRLLGNDVMTKTLGASTTIHVHDPAHPTPGFEFIAIGVVGITAVALSLFFLKRRKTPSRKAA